MKKCLTFSKFRVKKNTVIIKYVVFVFFAFASAFMLLRFPEYAGNGVSKGINICVKSVVPSLFPFMILSSVFSKSGICERIGKPFEKTTYILFKQPPIAFYVIIMSNIGGFPIGAGIIKSLYDSGKITLNEGKRLLTFCINPGPAFVINYVGVYLLSSAKAGLLIYISVVLSSLITGILSRFMADDNTSSYTAVNFDNDDNNRNNSLILCFVEAVKDSTVSIISVCSWVVVFSTIGSLIEVLDLSQNISLFINAVSEVTNACNICVGIFPVPIIAGIIGWSGICVHFQIMRTILKLRLDLKIFLTSRIINAAIAVIICKELFDFFPVNIAVFNNQSQNIALSSAGLPISAGLILMCVVLLIGDDIIIIKRKHSHKHTVEKS